MITRELAQRVLETVDKGLCPGLGENIPGKMCVEAAVCFAMGLPHGDNPPCVSNALRKLKMRLNDDGKWYSYASRAEGMRRLAIAQLGTAGTLNEREFVERTLLMVAQKILPIAFSYKNKELAEKLRNSQNLLEVKAILYFSDYDYASSFVIDSLDELESGYFMNAAHNLSACAGNASNNEETLRVFAEEVVQILKDMNTPGSEFLYLTEYT